MSTLSYSKEVIVAWSAAYLAAGGRQDKARESLISRGQPWHDILGNAGTKPSTWKPKASRLTSAAREAGALPKVTAPKRVQLQPLVQPADALLPGLIRDCMSAQEVLHTLSSIARGTHADQQGIKPEARLRFSLDALSQLVRILGIEPPAPGEESPEVERARLRKKLATLPQEVLVQLEAVLD